jgi:dihydroorotate dehydrogenase electron transfer subunit
MSQFIATVVGNEEIMPATHVLSLRAPEAAQNAAPGQFLHIRCGTQRDPFLRRPMSVYRTEGEVIQIMVRRIGLGSSWLVERELGDELNCLGPQGTQFKLDARSKNLLLVGGGYGVAPLVGLAERAIAKGKSVTLAVGAATAPYIFPPRLLPPQLEYLVATDDGSAGHHGFVTDVVPDWIRWADSVYACGPLAMMGALAARMRAETPRKRGQVAMEERMGCSMGVCMGCVVETNKGPLRVCTDGPVFDIYQIHWDQRAA